MTEKVMALVYYKASNGIYVANSEFAYNGRNPIYGNAVRINDKPLDKTNSPSWYFVADETEVLSFKSKEHDVRQTTGYKLKDESMFIEGRIPKYLSIEDVGEYKDDEYDTYWKNYSEISGLYSPIVETKIGEYKDARFTVQFLGTIEGDITKPVNTTFNVLREVNYKTESKPFDITSVVHYSELDTMLTPEFALHTKPCSISSKQTYDIIRTYVKDHIDPKMACITSDYNFCFTVKKKVSVKPWVKSTEIKTRNGRSYATPKFKTQTIDHIQVEIFEMTNDKDKYNNYTVIRGFSGENLEHLVDNIKSYLQDLIEYINMPVHQCSGCNGTGHIVGNNFEMNKRN